MEERLRIKLEDVEAVEAALREIQTNGMARKVTHAMIQNAVDGVEAKLATFLAKKHWINLIFQLDPQAVICQRYRRNDSTRVFVRKGQHGWYVIDVRREPCLARTHSVRPLNLAIAAERIAVTLSNPLQWNQS